jgi:cullin 1
VDFRKTNLTLYIENFEKDFLTETGNLYKQVSQSYLSDNPVTEYLKKCQEWLDEEEKRVVAYLHSSTRKSLISLTEEVLLTNHASAIQDQFLPLLEREKLNDLARMYTLLARVPDTLIKLRDLYELHVKEQGLIATKKVLTAGSNEDAAPENSGPSTPQTDRKTDIKAQTSNTGATLEKIGEIDPKVYFEALLQVYKCFAEIAITTFKAESGFTASLDKACREFVNRNAVCPAGSSKSAELLAKYADGLLRKSAKTNEDSEMEVLLDGTVGFHVFPLLI